MNDGGTRTGCLAPLAEVEIAPAVAALPKAAPERARLVPLESTVIDEDEFEQVAAELANP